MKRVLVCVFVLMCVCLITGCSILSTNSGTLTCTYSEIDDDGYAMESEVKVTYENNIVTKLSQTVIQEVDSDYLDLTVAYGESYAEVFDEVEGISMIFEKNDDNSIKSVITIDYEKIDIDALQELFGSDVDLDYYSTHQELESFKTSNLEGYTCK